jgi:type I restriction enzyme S subunit
MQIWKSGIIKDYGQVVTGHTPPTAQGEYWGEGYKFVTPTDLNFMNYFVDQTGSQVTEAARKKFDKKFLPPYSVSYTCIGNTIGKACLNREWVLTNQQINSIIPSKDHDYRFIYYQLNCLKNTIVGAATGAATPIINKSKFEGIKVKYPTLLVQQKIAGILSSYDDLIENNLKRIKLLEEMAQITYEEWFVRLRFPGHESTPINPETGLAEGWESIRCYDAMEVLSGGTPKTNIEAYWNGSIPFYTPKDALDSSYVFETEKYVTPLGVKKCNSKLYPKDTVFITARGTVGKINLAGSPMAMNQSCYALAGKEGVSTYFLFFSVKASVDAFRGASNGGVFNTIIVDTFRYLPFIKPTQDLMKKFEVYVSPILAEVFNLMRQNNHLREARDILLPRLMTGMIDVESYDPTQLLKDAA